MRTEEEVHAGGPCDRRRSSRRAIDEEREGDPGYGNVTTNAITASSTDSTTARTSKPLDHEVETACDVTVLVRTDPERRGLTHHVGHRTRPPRSSAQ